MKPGLHRPQAGSHNVVWWDPHLLRLNTGMDAGLKQQQILADTGVTPSDSMVRYQAWRDRRETALGAGRKSTFDIFTPSETAESPAGYGAEVRFEAIERDPARPAGPRFGTLVHAILRDAPLGAPAADVAALARLQGRMLGCSEDEIEAASRAAGAALRHALVARAARAERCHREFPLILRIDDHKLLEGVIDLAFSEGGQWHVVDFKTDADVETRRRHYENQLRWYAYAVATLAGAPVTAWLVSL